MSRDINMPRNLDPSYERPCVRSPQVEDHEAVDPFAMADFGAGLMREPFGPQPSRDGTGRTMTMDPAHRALMFLEANRSKIEWHGIASSQELSEIIDPLREALKKVERRP